jgi:hypothetical protein
MREIARRSGLSPAQISRIESGDVEQPSAETLTRIARALERNPEALLIATGRFPLPEATTIVGRMLEAVPSGSTSGSRSGSRSRSSSGSRSGPRTRSASGSVGLAGAWQALNEQAEKVRELEQEGMFLDAEASAQLEVFDSWRVERAEASHETEHYDELARGERDAAVRRDHIGRSSMARKRAAKAVRELEEAERNLDAVRVKVRQHQERLDAEERRLEDMVRDYAGQLFVRGGVPPLPLSALLEARRQSELAHPSAESYVPMLLSHMDPQVKQLDEKDLAAVEALAGDLAQVEQDWRDARARLLHYPEDRDFRQLARNWERLTPDRRRKVLEFVDDQRRLSVQEELQETREEVTRSEKTSSRNRRSGQ